MIYNFSLSFGIIFAFVTILAVRKHKLHFFYAFLWLILVAIIIFIPLTVKFWDRFAHIMGIDYGPSFIFLCAILFLIIYIYYLTITITKITDRTTRLTQEIGLLKLYIKEDKTYLDQ
ncbi:hypothetical protein DEAC_c18220 [Desulfosporosinus acididurans]|uniref:DUF2304 domain-containing protein n=1 Tax=Desulfosporosinus acididurans TaxID=476652 RepID=A0A0J1FTW1_9FIRM|nr:DUF2304 domain-containing protein [Desulfosporosinus acididurans]KLU66423.1 hypothetical protein DEAC_c18220 [Desulfosporosinus acididurans]